MFQQSSVAQCLLIFVKSYPKATAPATANPSAADLPRPRAAVRATVLLRVFSEMASMNFSTPLAWRTLQKPLETQTGFEIVADHSEITPSSGPGPWSCSSPPTHPQVECPVETPSGPSAPALEETGHPPEEKKTRS